MTQYTHQHDINGCGIACLANLLNKDYQTVKKDFENKFYKIDRGIKVFDMANYLNDLGKNYKTKFFNTNKEFTQKDFNSFSKIEGSITLIRKSNKYPVGHYLLRVKEGWVDSWFNLPSINNVYADVRKTLPEDPWYIVYPK